MKARSNCMYFQLVACSHVNMLIILYHPLNRSPEIEIEIFVAIVTDTKSIFSVRDVLSFLLQDLVISIWLCMAVQTYTLIQYIIIQCWIINTADDVYSPVNRLNHMSPYCVQMFLYAVLFFNVAVHHSIVHTESV